MKWLIIPVGVDVCSGHIGCSAVIAVALVVYIAQVHDEDGHVQPNAEPVEAVVVVRTLLL